jgi:tetratricopeptide (TPR) repeat protein/tRNA A-37 threonylcarbamoyl transferase component Bud32
MRVIERHDDCPSAEDLVRMVEGDLGQELVARLELHIDRCDSCRVAMSGLALGSTARPSGTSNDHSGLAAIDPEHYALGDEIARGGMGRIFRARDRRLGRDVAIKENFVRAGDAQRFEREARITARLQHPSIVQVHEAGVWPTGEPFYAMQLVSGRSLDDAVAAAKTLDERLALVPNALAVADAIAYAHSQGVIHRDLKPRNVLVGEYGETVVIDWGLAKDLNASAPEPIDDGVRASAGQTEHGAVIGTPAYMPPEQALGEPVDRRADVYALGAILYHVLSGRPPVLGSARTEVLATVGAGELEPLGRVQPGVPGDLLAIVTKAMAFEREDRYADARELAQDLRKFQTGQLVGARRYTWPHLVARWMRRHRTAVAVAAAAVIVLAIVGSVSLREVVDAKHVAETERATAEQNRGDAEDLMGFMLGDLHDKLQPVGKTELLDSVATKAIGYYQRRRPGSFAERHKVVVAMSNLGDVLSDEGHTAAALAQYRASLESAETLAGLDPGNWVALHSIAVRHQRIGDVLIAQGDNAGALADFRIDLGIQMLLAAREPDNLDRQRDLNVSFFKVAGVLNEMGRVPEAIANHRAALAISERLAEVRPSSAADRDLALDHSRLGAALANHGEREAAIAENRAALQVLDRAASRDPNDAQTLATQLAIHLTLGDILDQNNDDAAAEAAEYTAGIAVGERLIVRDPNDANWKSNVAYCRSQLAGAHHKLGQDVAAVAELETALAVQVELATEDPTQLDRQHDVELSHRLLAKIRLARGDVHGALKELATVLDFANRLAAKDPNNIGYRWDVGTVHGLLSDAQLAAGDHAAAVAELRAALAAREALAASAPGNPDYARDVTEARAELAKLDGADHVAAAPRR